MEGCTITPASRLPVGWAWHDWDDGSGALCSPQGDSFCSYDLQPYYAQGMIEHRIPGTVGWHIFYGDLTAYKKMAEDVIRTALQLAGGLPAQQGGIQM